LFGAATLDSVRAGSNGIETPYAQPDLVGHLAVIGFHDAKAIEWLSCQALTFPTCSSARQS